MWKCLFSYSKRDATDCVRQVNEDLTTFGYSVFIDVNNIKEIFGAEL